MFISVLGEPIDANQEKSAIFEDFHLESFITAANSLTRGYDLRPLFSYLPIRPEVIAYRREMTGDFGKEEVRNAFTEFVWGIEKVNRLIKNAIYNAHQTQGKKWHADSIYHFTKEVRKLEHQLSSFTDYSSAMEEFISYVKEYLLTEEFLQMEKLATEIHEKMDEEEVIFSIQKNKIVLEETEEGKDLLERVKQAFLVDSEEEAKPTWEQRKLSKFEESMAEQLITKRKLDKTFKQLSKYKPNETLLNVAYEVQFYLGFYRFAKSLTDLGYEFTMPEVGETIDICQGYDLALALKDPEKPVVANDFSLGKGENFAVITGANGGGKTTFARMVGQILYFSQLGLLTPCKKASLPFFTDIMSHFSKEESTDTGKGKLMEELIRLEPMINKDCKNCFVILNELFTTAATMDAGIMGKKVLQHFTEKGCQGIYVTHIQSLAEEGNQVVSMVAELEEDHHTRSFRIVRKPAKDGEYEDSLITKYHMTYEQMKKVLAGGEGA